MLNIDEAQDQAAVLQEINNEWGGPPTGTGRRRRFSSFPGWQAPADDFVESFTGRSRPKVISVQLKAIDKSDLRMGFDVSLEGSPGAAGMKPGQQKARISTEVGFIVPDPGTADSD